jgi:hypothetical protein
VRALARLKEKRSGAAPARGDSRPRGCRRARVGAASRSRMWVARRVGHTLG